VTTWWDQGYRARRILDLLGASGPLTVADFQRMQADVTSLPAAQLTPLLLAAGGAPGADTDATAGAALLNGWDFTMTRDSAAAAVFEVAAGNLARDLIEPALGKATYEVYRGAYATSGIYSVLLRQLLTPAAPFFTGDAAEARDALVARALGEAVRQLRSRLGPNPASWRWGDLHQATFAHPLASLKPLDRLFGVAPVARPGDSVTVSVGGDGGFAADPPEYAQHVVSSMREIIDLSALDHSLWVITTGESGVPFSSHYDDLVPLWDGNQYQQMAYSAEAEAAAAVDILVLKP
jgi:penicillin amidase